MLHRYDIKIVQQLDIKPNNISKFIPQNLQSLNPYNDKKTILHSL